jgi:uncharacterized membrane protein
MAQMDLSGIRPEAENDKVISALAYIFWFLVPIVILVTDLKNSRFNKLHAYQSLVFAGIGIAFYIAWSIFTAILSAVFWALGCVLWVGYLIPFVLAIYIAFRVFSAGQAEFPYLTELTKSIFKDI